MTEATTAQTGTGETAVEKIPQTTTETAKTEAAKTEIVESKTLAGGAETTEKTVSAPADWPEDWRTKASAGDKKFEERLGRFGSPLDLVKSYRALESKLSSGEVAKPKPENATPEQLAAWRAERGIPADPNGYIESVKLPNGIVLGEADKPLVEDFAKSVHPHDWKPEQVNQALAWYYDFKDKQEAARAEQDAKFFETAQDDLRTEFGPDFKRTINAVNALVAGMPEGLADRMLAGRTADGNKFGDDPAVIRWLASLQREINPLATLVPPGGGSGQDRLAEIRKFRKENPDKYDGDKAMQAEELKLLEAVQRMQSRGQAA